MSPSRGSSASAPTSPVGHSDQRAGRARQGLLSLGVGVVGAGVGAVIGTAAERLLGERSAGTPDTEPYGTLHSPGQMIEADDGAKLYVEVDELPHDAPAEARRRPVLIFSHGYALSMDTWHFQRKALRGRYRMVFWDQCGHGRSGAGPSDHCTIDQLGSDLNRVIAEVAPKGPLVLIGHSMGGMTVMSLAAHFPQVIADRVVGVAFVATSPGGLAENDLGLSRLGGVVQRMAPGTVKALTRSPRLVANARRMVSDVEAALVRRYSFASPVSQEVAKFTGAIIASTPLTVVSDFLPTFAVHDKRAALDEFKEMPALIIVGDHDLLTPASHSDEIAAHLHHAHHVVVPDGGHILMLEHPGQVNSALEQLLDDVAAGSGSETGKSRKFLRAVTRRR